jgi:hypothetical protein
MTEQVTISFTLSHRQADALGEIVKRLLSRDLGKSDLRLANPHQPDEQEEAKLAFVKLENALAAVGFKAQ